MSLERVSGLYRVHKPVGVTSHSIVRALAEELAIPGAMKWPLVHGGTLDPFAHGLLILLSGAATKLFEYLHEVPKTYVAELAWGKETDTGDLLGRVIAEGDASALTLERIEEATRAFIGWTEQVPPSTSAKKIGGEPAYKKVHRGEEVVLPPSRVYLHSARWLTRERVELVCRGGYYVRAFARDLGRVLGARAHVTSLWRSAIGPWEDPGPNGGRELIRGPAVLPWASTRALTDAEVGALRKGETVSAAAQRAAWSVPEGFPEPSAPVLGVHQGKVLMLLRPREAGLAMEAELRRGV